MLHIVATAVLLLCTFLPLRPGHASEDEHHSKNTYGFLVAGLSEEGSDGTGESGGAIGFVYERHLSSKWGFSLVIEREAFSDRTRRQGVAAVGGVYKARKNLSLFGSVGFEGRKLGEREHALLRVGVGYTVPLGKSVSLTPEFKVDFVEGGTQVYAVALVLGFQP